MASRLGLRAAAWGLTLSVLALTVAGCGGTGGSSRPISTGDYPYDLAVSSGGVWVVNYGSSTLQRIDPRIHRVTTTIRVGHHPDGVIARGRTLWVTSSADDAIYRVDPSRRKVTLRVPVPSSVADPRPSLSDIWVGGLPLNFVTAFNPDSGRFTARLPLHGAAWLTEAAGSVWVGSVLDRVVVRIDPSSGRTMASIRLAGAPWRLTSTPGAVWVNSQVSGRLYRIDPSTNRVSASLTLGDRTKGLAVGPDGRLWAAGDASGLLPSVLGPIDPERAHTYLVAIDPSTNRVVRHLATGAGFYGPIAFARSMIWVLKEGGSQIANYSLPRG